MACTLPYIESKFRQSNPEVADKLNNQHIKIVQDAVDSNLFRFKDRKLLFSQEGTKKLDRQRDYVNNINQQYGVNVLKNVDGVLSVNVLGLAPPIFTESSSILYQSILDTGVSPEEATRLYNQTKTPEFKTWFGNSKVVDENGEPLLVYHGTKSKEDFDTFKAGSSTGMFFTDDKQYAADVRGGRVVGPFFLRIEKPVEVKEELDNDVVFENKDKGDGIVGVDYGQGLSSDGKTFVVYNPNQIKSLNNTGQFGESSNIYYQQTTESKIKGAPELDSVLKEFMSKFGVKFKDIEDFKNTRGLDILGVTDILNKVIYLAENRKIDTLPEEVGHMITMLMGNQNPLIKQLMDNIDQWSEYQNIYNQYKDIYKTEEQIRFEAVGKLLAKHIVNEFQNSQDKSLFKRIIDAIKQWVQTHFTKNKVPDILSLPAATIASKIIKQDSGLISYKPRYNYVKLDADKAFRENPFEKSIHNIVTSEGGKLTGSLAIAAQADIFRDEKEPIHDLDYSFNDLKSIANTVAKLKELGGIYIHTSISNKDSTSFGVLVPKSGYEIVKYDREKYGWKKGTIIRDSIVVHDKRENKYYKYHESLFVSVDLFLEYSPMNTFGNFKRFDDVMANKQMMNKKSDVFFRREKDQIDYVMLTSDIEVEPKENYTYYQVEEATKPQVNETELENKLIEFLNSKGIAAEKIKSFQKRMGERGTPVTIYGMADMLNKLVKFSDVTSLVEEVAHMMVEMFVDTNNSILEQVVGTEEYNRVKEEYKDVYTTETQFRKEALGKIVKKAMIDRNIEGVASRLLSRIKYFWNKMVDFFKGVKGLDTYLEEIMQMNPSKFDSSRLGEGVYYEIQLTPEQKILNDAVEAKKRRLEGMKRRMTEAKVEKNLEDQINSLKLDILKDQVELGIEKLIGFIKEDLKVVEKYVFNNKSFSGNVLGHLKDFIYYYKPLLEDIQRIDGHKDINELIGRFRKVESVYIDSRKGAVKNELGIDVGSEIDTDINRAEYYFGSLRDVGSDIARRIHALITEMKHFVFQKMYEPSIDLIREVGNIDVKRLREKVGGKYTHFFVTQYKLGEWYESERSFKDALRKEFGLEDDQYEPLEKKDRIKYYRKLHQWKSKNQERRMLPEYYEMFLNLSYDTQVARDKYSADIKNLLLEVTSANGEVRFEDLTEEQWETLNRLNRERRMLGNLYYEDGTKKEGTDLEIALEIKELNSKLKDHQTKDTSKYNATWRTKKKELSPEKFKLWEERTTETVYADEFFELLDAVGRDDYSEEYIQLRDEKNELIKPYRKADLSAEPVDIPDSVRDRIKELDRRMDALRSIMPKREKLDVKFSDIADVVKIPEYSKEYDAAQKRGKDAFKEWYDANHYTDVKGVIHPISIWTQVIPKNKNFIKRVPKSYWMEVSKDSVFYNPNFDESWHGPQPTKQWHNPQYDSLTAAEKKGLDALLKMNMEAHDLYKSSPRRYYQLPQTTMSLFDAVTEEGRLANIKQVLLRSITDNSDDTEQGEVDEKGRMMQHIRPDGSQAYFIPKPFVRLVDDPNLISSDLVSSVIAIRTQAEKHRESLKINASTELLLDTLKDSRHVGKSGKVTLGSETNLYKAIRGFLEEHVFGIKTPPIGHVNVLGHNVNISKVLGKIEKYVRDKNLVGNLFVAATAATSGVVFSKIEDMVGTYTSNKSKMFANKEYLLNSPAMMLEAGKKVKTNKVGLIISRFIGEQDMFDDLDKNRMARLGTETPYAPFTMVGHNISGRVVIAMLHNTRWDGNKFVTSQNYRGKDFDSLPSMYSMFEGKDNKAVVKKEYQDILTLKEIAKMTGKIRFVTDRIDSKISDTDKAAAHRDALLKLATTHRGWLFRNTQDRFKSKGFNYITEEFEEGHYRTWWRFLTKTVMRPNRLRILKNLLAEWETLEPYEKRNVIRSLWELGAAVSVGILARALQNLADDDDEDYLLNMASYVMNRTLLEVSVYPSLLTPLTFPIGISEVGSLLSSPIAAVSVVNTLTDVVYLFDSEEIESGRFEGMTHREKFLIKMTPGLSGYYTTTDPTSANQFLKGKALRPLNFIYKDE